MPVSAALLALFVAAASPASAEPRLAEASAGESAAGDSRESTRLAATERRSAGIRFLLKRRGRTVRVGVRVLRGEGRVIVRMRRLDGRYARRLRLGRRGDLWRYVFRLPTRGTWTALIRFRPERGWTGVFARSRPFAVRE